ncbi:MAG: PKD domain-containing protein, partial [Flavobacteriales bacterium]|nr:PKD domain-containing protein [Flavobacteriales bacterium]
TVSTAEGCTDASTQEVEIISAPDASFTVSTDDGCSPLQVHFGNTSSGNYSTYEWELDGGTESAFEPADHLFEAQDDEAEFDITLQVTNACGSDEAVHMVTVHPLPNANFDTNIVSTQCSPVSVEFINVTTGNADSYYWSFGDGTQSLDETPELNIYTTGLTSTVFGIWLYATNTCGIDSVLKEVTVLPNLVTSSFETSINSGCEPLAVDFTNSGSGATAVEYDFGGAGSAISFNSSFEFSDDGVYDVIQYATDGCGFDTSYAQITVLNSPQAVINADDDDVCLGDIIHFSSVTEDAVSMEWDFDNGTIASDPGADVTYIADGDYTVTFTATAATLCTYSTTLDIAVNPLPQAAFTPNVSTSCAPLEVCFNNESTGAVSYTWTSDDGTALAGTSPCATFANTGDVPVTRTIQLTAENAAGCTHQVSAEVEVLPIPDAQFVLSQLSTCESPAATTVLASDFADNYAWTVNGTPTSSDAEPVFDFDSPGEYTIVLTTTNLYGCSNVSEQVFEAFEPAVAAFEMSDDLVCVNEVLEWISTSTNAISWTWDFGDGTTGVGVNPQHAYESEGVYDVSLTVMSADGCEATAELPSALTVLPLPEPDFEASAYVTSVYYATISFTGMPDGMSDYEWDFADGGTASTQQSEHTFNNTGEFPVVLQVTDASGCTAQVMHEIVITAEFSVYVPNSFTPNGDGINDTFVPVIAALDAIDNYEMHIFDRWGVEVFFSRDPYERWTGDVAGGTHFGSTDVYSYRMNVRLEGSPEFREITGFITLIR